MYKFQQILKKYFRGYLGETHQSHQTWCLLGGEKSSRGGSKVGGDGRGNPLPKRQGGVDGDVVHMGREASAPPSP